MQLMLKTTDPTPKLDLGSSTTKKYLQYNCALLLHSFRRRATLAKFTKTFGQFSGVAIHWMACHAWPSNVQQLRGTSVLTDRVQELSVMTQAA
jgi:hypothetical protein